MEPGAGYRKVANFSRVTHSGDSGGQKCSLRFFRRCRRADSDSPLPPPPSPPPSSSPTGSFSFAQSHFRRLAIEKVRRGRSRPPRVETYVDWLFVNRLCTAVTAVFVAVSFVYFSRSFIRAVYLTVYADKSARSVFHFTRKISPQTVSSLPFF